MRPAADELSAEPPTLKFLGTAGARHVVSTQARHSGGLVYRVNGFQLWVDPGPGALVRALSARPKIDPARTGALLVSHRHLDHSGDATAVLEAMTRGGTRRGGTLLAPADTLEGGGPENPPMIQPYAQAFVEEVVRLRPGLALELAPGLALSVPLAHDHGVETYGYRLAWAGFTVGHVVDTFWTDDLPAAYAGVDLLLVNTTRPEGGDRRILHLGADDAERLVAAVRPRGALLTHFGMRLLRGRAEEVARDITARTGVPTLAARDGLTYRLQDPPPAAPRTFAEPEKRP